MRLFGITEANTHVPMLLDVFARVRALVDEAQIRRELAVLEQLGIEVKDPSGLVDFRSLRDGEVVYLCWKFPEPAVSHWHRLDAGFAGRKPISSNDDFAASWAN